MAPLPFARALGKAATAVNNLQSRMTKKTEEKPEKIKQTEDSAEDKDQETAVQPAFPKQESASPDTDILPLIEKQKNDVSLVTRPTPIPLEVNIEELTDSPLPESLDLPEADKETSVAETDPEPNVQMVADLNEIRSKKKGGQAQKPETGESKPKPSIPPASLPENKLEIQGKKPEATEQKAVIAETKQEVAEKKPELQKNQPEIKAAKTEARDKNEGDGSTGEPAKKPVENTGDKSLFDNLFNKVEEKEETALDRMIKALPEISIEEVLSEASEVNSLIADWNNNLTKCSE
jgi:hypothetical protein